MFVLAGMNYRGIHLMYNNVVDQNLDYSFPASSTVGRRTSHIQYRLTFIDYGWGLRTAR